MPNIKSTCVQHAQNCWPRQSPFHCVSLLYYFRPNIYWYIFIALCIPPAFHDVNKFDNTTLMAEYYTNSNKYTRSQKSVFRVTFGANSREDRAFARIRLSLQSTNIRMISTATVKKPKPYINGLVFAGNKKIQRTFAKLAINPESKGHRRVFFTEITSPD